MSSVPGGWLVWQAAVSKEEPVLQHVTEGGTGTSPVGLNTVA